MGRDECICAAVDLLKGLPRLCQPDWLGLHGVESINGELEITF